MQRILEHSEARFVLVEDQEQADKVLGVRGATCRGSQRIVVDDMRGLEDYRDPMLVSLEERARPRPRRSTRASGDATTPCSAPRSPTDVALLAYTSGTTGAAKAAMISHRNLLAMAASVTEVDPVHDSDDIVSFLPFAWVGEQLLSVAIALHAGATVNFPEEPETVRDDLREIGPHVMIAPPRFWEAMCSEYQVKIGRRRVRSSAAATRAALALGERVTARELAGGPAGLGPARARRLAHLLAFRTLLDKLGLSRVRYAYTGGAPLGAGDLPVLPGHRPQPQAGVRPDGVRRHLRAASRRRRPRRDGGQAHAGDARAASPRPARSSSRATACSSATTRTPRPPRTALDDGWLRTGDAGVVDERRPPGR